MDSICVSSGMSDHWVGIYGAFCIRCQPAEPCVKPDACSSHGGYAWDSLCVCRPDDYARIFFLVILFFWVASPVSGHMISRLEAMTDNDLGEMLILHCPEEEKPAGEEEAKKHADI